MLNGLGEKLPYKLSATNNRPLPKTYQPKLFSASLYFLQEAKSAITNIVYVTIFLITIVD